MENKKSEKQNALVTYLKGALEEMRKVTWPSREEAWRKAWIVIWFSAGFAFVLGTMDYALNQFIDFII